MKKFLLSGVAMAMTALPLTAASAETPIKNVIIMIADGAGYNTLEAARLWQGPNAVGSLVVDGPDFLATSVSTYPLDTRTSPIAGPAGLQQNPNTVYDPAKNWDTDPVAGTVGGYPRGFEGYEWNRATAPDSANTIAALMTGTKTYNNAVNVNGNGDALITVAELAVQGGREAGVVSTVQFSDATPATGGGAHNVTRANRTQIANEMFTAGTLNVIGGAGNPDYDDNGNLRGTPDYSWISQSDWNALKNGTLANEDGNWTLYQDRADIQALANGSATAPENLAMISKSFNGNDQYRGAGLLPGNEDAFSTPLREDVPNLTELTLAALNRLNSNPDGLYLLAEEGEVDRAMHSNNIGRMIEAYLEFNAAVQAVVDWVDSEDSAATWGDTLLIVSADHDHLLFGPDADTDPFQQVLQDGDDAGLNPDHRWFSGSHSNQLVPLFARGVNADEIISLADDLDFYQDAQGRTFGRGFYTDQAEIGRYLLGQFAAPVPEPASWAMMIAGFGLIGGALRRRQATVRFA